jgi:hypothetical protein
MIQGKRLILPVEHLALSSWHSANAGPMPISGKQIQAKSKISIHPIRMFSRAEC